jgi:hypothetical protein
MAKSHFRMEVKNEWYIYRATAIESVCQVIGEHLEGIENVRTWLFKGQD